MRRNSKYLISIISAVMICLLASTATTTVAAGEWGNLTVGDTMTWKAETMGTSTYALTAQMEILRISDDSLTVKVSASFNGGSMSSSTVTEDNFMPFIAKQSDLVAYSQVIYNFGGTNYDAAYLKIKQMEDGVEWTHEFWWDTGTGVLFENIGNSDQDDSLVLMLVSTTADLTASEGGECLGTLLIALVSVVTMVSYSLVRYQKKKRT